VDASDLLSRPRRLLRSRFVRGTGIAGVAQFSSPVLGYAVHWVLARWVGADVYGIYSYALAWTGILSMLATVGLPYAAVRFAPVYQSQGDHRLLHGLVRGGTRLLLVAGGAMGLLAFLVLPRFAEASYRTAVGVGLLLVPMFAAVQWYTALCRVQGQATLAYVLPRLGRSAVLLAGLLALLAWPGVTPTAVHVLLIVGGALAGVALVQRWGMRRRLAPTTDDARPAYAWRTWLPVALPLLGINLAQLSIHRVDVLLIGSVLGAQATGVYSLASVLANLVTFVLRSVDALAAPRYAHLHAAEADDPGALQRFVGRLAPWVFWPSAGVALALALGGPWLLGTFGPAYEAAYLPLLCLAGGYLVNAACGSVGYLLTLTGHQGVMLRVMLVSALVNVGLNAVGLALFGGVGVAAATGLTIAGWNVWLLGVVRHRLGVDPSIFGAWRARPTTPASDA
jgi:O-antigen/teichoic acid export membrane protein